MSPSNPNGYKIYKSSPSFSGKGLFTIFSNAKWTPIQQETNPEWLKRPVDWSHLAAIIQIGIPLWFLDPKMEEIKCSKSDGNLEICFSRLISLWWIMSFYKAMDEFIFSKIKKADIIELLDSVIHTEISFTSSKFHENYLPGNMKFTYPKLKFMRFFSLNIVLCP